MTTMKSSYILTLSCVDRPGLIALVSTTLFMNGGNIIDAQQFNDRDTSLFFMRVFFETEHSKEPLHSAIEAMATKADMTWNLHEIVKKQRVLILVSKFDHCLNDILYRTRVGELDMDIIGIVSNHPREVQWVSMIEDVPFYYLP